LTFDWTLDHCFAFHNHFVLLFRQQHETSTSAQRIGLFAAISAC